MSLPASFLRDGFQPAAKARSRMKLPDGRLLKPILIGTEGESDTGKTEFLFSCPGPGIIIALERGHEGMLDNPNPPAARRLDDFAIKAIPLPASTTAKQPQYLEYFQLARSEYYKALANLDAVVVAVDGDSDFWEIQRLGEWGRLTGIFPQTKYGDVYAARRAMTARAYDSGKIVIGTNKVRDEYETVYGPDGLPLKEQDGSEKKRKTGNKQRQGFPDQNYLWQIQIRHLYRPATRIDLNTLPPAERLKAMRNGGGIQPKQWGIRILKCKINKDLEGDELWGDQCNFAGLVQHVFPHVPLREWGF